METATEVRVPLLRASNRDFRSILKQRAELVSLSPLFAEIPLEDCVQIVSPTLERNFPRAKTIYFEGDAAQQVYHLISGCVKVSQFSPNGDEVILRVIGPGECFGIESSAKTGHRSTARTVARSTALVWEAKQFEAVTERFPVLRRNVCYVLQRYLNRLEQRYLEISTQKVAMRLSLELLRLLHHVGTANDGQVEIALAGRELAQLTGTTIFTVSRLLCRWETLGVVRCRRGAVVVLDARALEGLSGIE